MTWQLGAGADLSVWVSFQLFCRNWCSSSTLMNCVLASEGPSTLPSDNVGLIGGEVPHQSRIRLRANGLEWDWLLGLCQHRGFLRLGEGCGGPWTSPAGFWCFLAGFWPKIEGFCLKAGKGLLHATLTSGQIPSQNPSCQKRPHLNNTHSS